MELPLTLEEVIMRKRELAELLKGDKRRIGGNQLDRIAEDDVSVGQSVTLAGRRTTRTTAESTQGRKRTNS